MLIPNLDRAPTSPLGSADDFRHDAVMRSFEASLSDLGTSYVDVYMLHGPVNDEPTTIKLRREAWRALEQLYDE